jgi:N6-adenosine-specific RNA methylase IME4
VRLQGEKGMSNLVLAKIDRARTALMVAKTAIEAKQVADMAKAAIVFATRQKSAEAKAFAHEIWIEALRLEGQFLSEQPKNEGAKGIGPIAVSQGHRNIQTLKQQGIPRKESVIAQSIARAAKEVPDLFEKVKKGGRINDIRRHYKKQEHKLKVAKSKVTKVEIEGPFDIILADPPWQYEHCEANNREIENHYESASILSISSHFKEEWLKDNCVLFLWATAPKLKEALHIMTRWGFVYRSCAIWDKEKIGLGYWWRIQHELLLVGVRGSPQATPECERVSSIFREKRTTHSTKPECVYEWIEKAFPLQSKLEMYCRKPRKGWGSWGNEV